MTRENHSLPQVGDIVGDYRISGRIGKGGTGTVFSARSLATGEQVAIKLMLPAMLAAHPELAVRALREAQVGGSIQDPGVVDVLGSGAWHGLPYIVMEYVEGTTLLSVVRERPLSLESTQRVVADIARALSVAHADDIVHRDIKPGNVMMLPDGRVKILDFGLAKVLLEGMMSITAEGTALGSPAYMSPEQTLSSNRVDARADLWSLACITYFLLTGLRPFRGNSIGEKITAVMMRDYVRVSELRPELGSEIDRWFERAFARDIDDRFQSADELANSLREVRAGVFEDSITCVMPRRRRVPSAPPPPPGLEPDPGPGRFAALLVGVAAAWLVVIAAGAIITVPG